MSYDDVIIRALAEDAPWGDITSELLIPEEAQVTALLDAREPGVFSGGDVFAAAMRLVDPRISTELHLADGTGFEAGDVLATVEGPARGVLRAERVGLNLAQRMSGIATLTARYVEAVRGTKARILDTRKTTPGFRLLEKQAVLHGGGTNHRIGLYDRAMVKDNHLVAEGGTAVIQAAIYKLKNERPGVEVELEADNLDQVKSFLEFDGVDHILLDNMTLDELRGAVGLRGDDRRPFLEASGGVTFERLRNIAKTGVDFISVGALTHSAPALDIGLDFTPIES